MSRNPVRSKKPQATGSQPAVKDYPGDKAVIDQAHALYGNDAATAIAYCGLDAWFDANPK